MAQQMDTRLKDVPEDVRKIILKKQTDIKNKKGHGNFSMASTVYAIIREWNNKCKEA
jgi:hypothetical protein